MNKQQVEIAVGAGLELLGDKSEITIPVKLNDGVFLLKQLLMLLVQGQLGLTPTVQTDQPESQRPPIPKAEVRKAVRKVLRKKSPPNRNPKPKKRR